MSGDGIEARAQYLVDNYADMILRISYSYLRSTADAEDICQDVLLKLLTKDVEFLSTEHEKAWIIRVAINACADLARKADRSRSVPLAEDTDIPDDRDEFNPATQDVMRAVDSLPDTYRASIYLRYYEGYTSKEIAEMTGQSVSAVDQQLSRGRKLLKVQLEGEYA